MTSRGSLTASPRLECCSVTYDVLVNVVTKEDPDRKVPFSSLSKSGGIVNAYNALLMAEKVVKEKE